MPRIFSLGSIKGARGAVCQNNGQKNLIGWRFQQTTLKRKARRLDGVISFDRFDWTPTDEPALGPCFNLSRIRTLLQT